MSDSRPSPRGSSVRPNRREFLLAAGSAALVPGGSWSIDPRWSEGVIGALVERNDARVPGALEGQDRREGGPMFGGVPNAHGIFTPHGTAGLIRTLATAFVSPGGRHRGDGELLGPMRDAARYLLRSQHADGTIDLYSTNFHSTPDLAFVFEPVCVSVEMLRASRDARCGEVLELLDGFARKGGEALTVGGIHTPNHRWVVCAALAMANALWPDERYVERIDEWLAEGIDIDPDGQFTERSTSIYSPLTCKVLMTTARLRGREDLYEPVRRNLAMTLHYVHADGEVATEASRRQDQGSGGPMTRYHYPYRYMAVVDGDGRFAAMARWIEELSLDRLVGDLPFYLTVPEMRAPMPDSAPLPMDFEKHFRHSRLVRIRRGEVSATILEDSATVLTFRKGGAALDALRFASAFFGKGQFVGGELTKDGEWWVMEQRLEGPYYQPLPKELLPDDGDWEKMDRDRRPQSEVQQQNARVRVREHDGGLEVEVAIVGTDHVPVAVELAFRRGGELSGVTPVEGVEDAWLLAKGTGRYSYGGREITFGPGTAPHTWTQLRGALPKTDAMSVYVTGFTPFRRTFFVK